MDDTGDGKDSSYLVVDDRTGVASPVTPERKVTTTSSLPSTDGQDENTGLLRGF